mgnify:CR=1 FL=1
MLSLSLSLSLSLWYTQAVDDTATQANGHVPVAHSDCTIAVGRRNIDSYSLDRSHDTCACVGGSDLQGLLRLSFACERSHSLSHPPRSFVRSNARTNTK